MKINITTRFCFDGSPPCFCDWRLNLFYFCSKEEGAEFVARLKGVRNEARVPDTLLLLTMNSVIKNNGYFLKHRMPLYAGPHNPFNNLRTNTVILPKNSSFQFQSISAQTLAQALLDLMLELRKKLYDGVTKFQHARLPTVPKDFHSNAVENCFLLQLLNGSVTEFDYEQFCHSFDSPFDSVSTAGMFFRHMLENCPKIKKIAVDGKGVWENQLYFPRMRLDGLFLLMAKWENLTFLSVKDDPIILEERSVARIQKSFPKLRSVQFF